jgi:HSP20 family molecular chaperone IbpA
MSTVLIERVRHLKEAEKPPAFAEVEKMTAQIQQRAFSLFKQHGGLPGFDLDNWLLAEREVLGPSAAELVESDKELKLRVAVPGAEARDLRVTATPEAIIVEANTHHEHSGSDGELRFCEFSENKLCRQFGLPSEIDVNKVSASLDKGILEVVAAKPVQKRTSEARERLSASGQS